MPDIPVITAPATVVANGEPQHTNGTNGAPVTNGVPPITLLPVIIPQIAAGPQAKAPWSPVIFGAIIAGSSSLLGIILTVGGALLSNHLDRIQEEGVETRQAVADVIEEQDAQGLVQADVQELLADTKESVDGNYSELQQQLVDARARIDDANAQVLAESQRNAAALAIALEQLAGLQQLVTQMSVARDQPVPAPEPQSDLAPAPHRTSGRSTPDRVIEPPQ